MVGLVALVIGLAVIAGGCAFVIDYGEELRRFPKRRARQRGLMAGLVAASFFLVLGIALILFFFH